MSFVLNTTSCTDYSLFFAILLGTSFVYNKGHILPRRNKSEAIFYDKVQTQDANSSRSSATRDLGEKVKETGAQFVILWGSQSGTAENLAQRLQRDIRQRFGSQVVLGDISEYDPATVAHIPSHVFLVVVMSTYGEGDPAHNAHDFVHHVVSSNGIDLAHLRFASFGCGNSSYRRFNQAIYDTTSALERHGAKAILPAGAGDEAKRSTLEDFHEWKASFFSCLVSQYALSECDLGYQPTVDVKLEDLSGNAKESMITSASHKTPGITLPTVMTETIARYNDPLRSCVHVKLDLSRHSQVKYRTGDHLAVWPRNPEHEVASLLAILQKESVADHFLKITPIEELVESNMPPSMTLRDLLSKHLDICARVPRETILLLATMAKNPEVAEELNRISSTKEAYENFLLSHHLTLPKLLSHTAALYPHSSWDWLPLSFLIDLIPPIKPRLYSIGSSSIVEPKQLSLVISVKPNPISSHSDSVIHGLSSTYLANLQSGASPTRSLVQAEIRRSDFKLPFNSETPVIMVAAGTGIAPFRAFAQERARLASIGRPVGPMLLFFGCQTQSDCLFYDELKNLNSSARASSSSSPFDLKIHTAFSQQSLPDTKGGNKTGYVQDRLFEHRETVLKHLLDDDAGLYICGATAMSKAVTTVLLDALMTMKNWTSDEAEQWRQERRKAKRWSEDVWS